MNFDRDGLWGRWCGDDGGIFWGELRNNARDVDMINPFLFRKTTCFFFV